MIAGNVEELRKLIQQAIDDGCQGGEILEKGLISGMDVVGQRMKTGEMFISEVLCSAKTMQVGMDVCLPFLSESDVAGAGTVVIGTVEGDLHDIGKNLVAMMLKGEGFKAIDLGIDVMVGSAPVTQGFADRIGADAYGANAREAVQKARKLAPRVC